MKAFDIEAAVRPDGTITLPADVVAQVGPSQTVRLLVLVEEPLSEEEEAAAWERAAAENFFKGYAPEDAIYDNL
jgi:hypothetical protein